MTEHRQVKAEVTHQGAVIANDNGVVYRESEDICIVCMDLETERARTSGTGFGGGDPPNVFLEATEGSIHLHKEKSRDEVTVVSFPEFVGWTIFMADVSRYTLSLTFLKDKEQS